MREAKEQLLAQSYEKLENETLKLSSQLCPQDHTLTWRPFRAGENENARNITERKDLYLTVLPDLITASIYPLSSWLLQEPYHATKSVATHKCVVFTQYNNHNARLKKSSPMKICKVHPLITINSLLKES